MNAKDHYDRHLGNFYAWMVGNFEEKQKEQETFFQESLIAPTANSLAIDLGAGHGLQSIALARLGFSVKAIDFNKQLLNELGQRKGNLDIDIVQEDILAYLRAFSGEVQVIVCMGDTITHLENLHCLDTLIKEIANHLIPAGKVILSFRDLTKELKADDRFIAVKSDENRILTCFLEYFPGFVMVHDILHERQGQQWLQKVSAYPKLRIDESILTDLLKKNEIRSVKTIEINRMIYLIGEKKPNGFNNGAAR